MSEEPVTYRGKMTVSQDVQASRCLYCGKGGPWWQCDCVWVKRVNKGELPKPVCRVDRVAGGLRVVILLPREIAAENMAGLRPFREPVSAKPRALPKPRPALPKPVEVDITPKAKRGATIVLPIAALPAPEDPQEAAIRARGPLAKYASKEEQRKAYRARRREKLGLPPPVPGQRGPAKKYASVQERRAAERARAKQRKIDAAAAAGKPTK